MADSARAKLLVEYAEQGNYSPPLALTYAPPAYTPSEPQTLLQQRLVLQPGVPRTVPLPPISQLLVVTNRATGVSPDAQSVLVQWQNDLATPTTNAQNIPPGAFVAIGGPTTQAAGVTLTVQTYATSVDVVILGRQSAFT